jgi:hypothetical protein
LSKHTGGTKSGLASGMQRKIAQATSSGIQPHIDHAKRHNSRKKELSHKKTMRYWRHGKF